MWLRMANEQHMYDLSERLMRAIGNWQSFGNDDDDVEQLIELGADVNRLHGTLLPLHCACMVSDSCILRLLIRKGAKPKTVQRLDIVRIFATECSKEEILKVNEYDGYERAALHYAAERDIFCVEILLDHGADINVGDGNCDTPLHWATFKNNIQCVKLLLQHGAKVDPLDYNHDTPLSWAARKGHLEVIQILLEYNADPQIENCRGVTPVHKAMQVQMSGLNTEEDNRCMDVLLKASCKTDLTDQQIDTIRGDNRLYELLSSRFQQPCSLQGQCRYRIRRSLDTRFLPNVIPKLPVPQRLKDYIALKC